MNDDNEHEEMMSSAVKARSASAGAGAASPKSKKKGKSKAKGKKAQSAKVEEQQLLDETPQEVQGQSTREDDVMLTGGLDSAFYSTAGHGSKKEAQLAQIMWN